MKKNITLDALKLVREHAVNSRIQREKEEKEAWHRLQNERYEKIISDLESRLIKAARDEQSFLEVMRLESQVDHPLRGSELSPTELLGAGRVVYQFCVDNDWEPTIEHRYTDNDSWFAIVIRF